MRRLRDWLTYSNVVSTICLFLLLGGGAAYAASHLGKNSVGSKQLRKNAVTATKIKNGAVSGAKIKAGSVTGTQIDASTLGTVPSARSAETAQTANALGPPEAVHEVGAPGEPAFQNGWKNNPPGPGVHVAFYKDHEGIVHLTGDAIGGEDGSVFYLPPGYRPDSGKILVFPVFCVGCTGSTGALQIYGPNYAPSTDGAVVVTDGTAASLDGVTFRAGA